MWRVNHDNMKCVFYRAPKQGSPGMSTLDPRYGRAGGGEVTSRAYKIYYICFKQLFSRPCSNAKRVSGTSNSVGHLKSYKQSYSAQWNVILQFLSSSFVSLTKLHCLYGNSIIMEWSCCLEIIRKWKPECRTSMNWNPAQILTQIAVMKILTFMKQMTVM